MPLVSATRCPDRIGCGVLPTAVISSLPALRGWGRAGVVGAGRTQVAGVGGRVERRVPQDGPVRGDLASGRGSSVCSHLPLAASGRLGAGEAARA